MVSINPEGLNGSINAQSFARCNLPQPQSGAGLQCKIAARGLTILFFGALTSFNELEHALRIKRIHTGLDDEKGAGRFNGDPVLILDCEALTGGHGENGGNGDGETRVTRRRACAGL